MIHKIMVVLDVTPEDTNKVISAVKERMNRMVDDASFQTGTEEKVVSVEAVKEDVGTTPVGVHYFPFQGLGDEGRKVDEEAVVSGANYRECLDNLVNAINNDDIDDINNELVVIHS